ncbi:MAG: L-asparaginase [Frankiales bacterium]|nr:L-asparaginase [Frankiales bacterium]
MILAEVTRSGYVEGTHAGHVLAVRGDGSVALALGDVDRPLFPRSVNKPLQAAAMIDLGWRPANDLELALATSSHSGEPGHLDVVRGMLGDGLTLQCPPMPPVSEAAWHDILRAGGEATALTMNCSGKHAAMLRTCVANGWPTETYLLPDHPLQVALRKALERFAGEPVVQVAVDGCGAPQLALTLEGLCRAFAGMPARVRSAMTENPWYVGGTARDVTALMEGVPGLVAKDGAEGTFAAALPDGSAVALKIEDGSGRARTPVMVAALRALGVDAPVLDDLAETPVLGGGKRVGSVRVVF